MTPTRPHLREQSDSKYIWIRKFFKTKCVLRKFRSLGILQAFWFVFLAYLDLDRG